MIRLTLAERIAANSCPEPNTGCWLWERCTYTDGYPMMQVAGHSRRATRVSFEVFVGPLDPALWVLHRCDTPLCVNPAHLFLGTVQDNNADRDAKGRTAKGDRHWSRTMPRLLARGERQHKAKLTAAVIPLIREAYAEGATQEELGAEYGVSHSTIGGVLRRKTWRHVQ